MEMNEGKIGKIFFCRIFEDEDLLEAIRKRAEKAKINSGFFILIGSLKEVKLGFYKERGYKRITVEKPLEIVSCMGNVSVRENGKLVVHAHLVVSDENGKAFGGHLLEGCKVAATAELTLVEAIGVDLKRKFDEKTGLYLLASEQ
jgi:hypothetical protein